MLAEYAVVQVEQLEVPRRSFIDNPCCQRCQGSGDVCEFHAQPLGDRFRNGAGLTDDLQLAMH